MQSRRRHPAVRRALPLLLSVALLGTVSAACTPPTPPPATQQFCEFWDKVAEAPPTADQAVLVKPEVVALAEDTTVTGSDCTAAGAKVALDGAVLAEGAEVPVEQGTASTDVVAAITGEEIDAGEPVLDNVTLRALSAEIGTGGITVRGNVDVSLSGNTSTIGFTGTLQNLENWSVNLSSSNLIIPGVTTSPTTFSGTLKVTNGVPSLALTAAATNVKIGDITVSAANVRFDASPLTGVQASVQGSLKIGPSTVNGTVDVDFDRTGALVSAAADIDARLVGTMTGGKKADLTGTVSFRGNAKETVVTFNGAGILGDLQVAEANGSLTLATNKATFVGKIDVAQGATRVRFNGSIVWDGITAANPFLVLEGEGEYSGVLSDGTTVSVAGTVSTEVVGGQLRAVVTGAVKVGALTADGSAVVEANGATTNLIVDANVRDAGFAARLQGAVVITDGIAETVQLDAAVTGPLRLGDATVDNGSLSIRSTGGSSLDVKVGGRLRVGTQVDLAGELAASFGPRGSLISLTGALAGSATLDSWALADFAAAVVVTPERVTVTGDGSVRTTNFPLGVTLRGTFTSSLQNPSWSLTGSGRLTLFSLTIAGARISLSQGEGAVATRAGFYLSIIGIPTYLEADFYLAPTGGCSKVQLTGGSFLARPLATLILPGVVGCPVYN
jgi:hypothetical protein